MRCRRNYRDLSSDEKARYVNALGQLKSNGTIDTFANQHSSLFDSGIHMTSDFLPWHRDFLRRFEDALRAIDPSISIPYWNSTVDQSASDPLWDASFLGQFDSAWGLGRTFTGPLPTPQEVTDALAIGPFDTFWDQLETVVHNPPHVWVGGVMGGTASPGDPVFYLHHCWIDLLWAEWQLLHPGAAWVVGPAPFSLGVNDPMPGVSATPNDVMDHRTINVYDYPSTFTQQDAPRVTADVTTVSFLDVPVGETRLAAAVFDIDTCDTLTFRVTAGPTLTSGPAGTMFGVFQQPVPGDPDVDEKARLFFTYVGTAAGDAATGTATVSCDQTGDSFPVVLTANTIARPTAAICMLLDQSNSMNFDSGIGTGITRADVLRFSAPTAVVVLDDTNAAAVCTFDQDAHPGIGITPASGPGKITINAQIAAYAPNSNGWTAIGEGVAFAQGLLAPVTNYDVKAMVVFTDGDENHGPYTRRYIADVADLISSLNGRVYAIGLGRPEVLNPTALQNLCSGNDGYMLITGDLDQSASYRLAKYYQQILAGVTNHDIVLDPEGFLVPGVEQRIPFWLNETDLTAKCVLLTPAPHLVRYVLETPAGDIIDPGVAAANPMASFEASGQVAFYRVDLPIPLGAHTAQAGRWHARLVIDEKRRRLDEALEQPVALASTHSVGLRYNFSVQAYSNLRMRASLAQDSNEPGARVTIRAVLTEYGLPVAHRAHCRTELGRPDGTHATLAMSEVEPGVFEATFVAAQSGVYGARVIAAGHTMRGRAFTREQTLTGSVWKGGDAPPPSSGNDPNAGRDRICRLLECLLRQPGIAHALGKAGIEAAALRRCLEECCHPHAPPRTTADRLRGVLRDERIVRALLDALGEE
jgi:hypothetical protein